MEQVVGDGVVGAISVYCSPKTFGVSFQFIFDS